MCSFSRGEAGKRRVAEKQKTREALMLLPELYGNKSVLLEAQEKLPDYPVIQQALHDLNRVEQELVSVVDTIAFDLADRSIF